MNVRDESEKCIAVFGLTGDPFTIAHRDICERAMDVLPIDKLYVIPTVVDYHREGKKRWLSDDERLECIKYMLWSLGPKYLGKWEIYDHEIQLKALCENRDEARKGGSRHMLSDMVIKPRRFLHTLLDFKAAIGWEKPIMLILGTDSVKNFRKWFKWREVGKCVDSFVMVNGRDGKEINVPESISKAVKRKFRTLDLTYDELKYVSASRVRNSYDGCDRVWKYMADVWLYDSGKKSLDELGWMDKKGRK